MKIWHSELMLATKDEVFVPFDRYVIPESLAREFERQVLEKNPLVNYTMSDFNSYERRYAGQPLRRGDSLLIYRHGAFGDTLMSTAVVRWIRKQNPEATIDLYCRPEGVEMWHGAGCRAIPGYPSFDAARRYKYHLLYEKMLENDSEDDQVCAIDNAFAFGGMDPAQIPDADKLPVVVGKEGDGEPPFTEGRKHIVIQMNASNPNRTYPWMNEVMALLRQEMPNYWLFPVGDDKKLARFRNLIPLVRNASLVICPDSSIGHLAAAFPEVPVISLWGLFHPNDRIKYYRNHHPIFLPEACPHAPCRSHLFTLPVPKCHDAPTYDGKSCAALAAIKPEMVVEKARQILGVS